MISKTAAFLKLLRTLYKLKLAVLDGFITNGNKTMTTNVIV